MPGAGVSSPPVRVASSRILFCADADAAIASVNAAATTGRCSALFIMGVSLLCKVDRTGEQNPDRASCVCLQRLSATSTPAPLRAAKTLTQFLVSRVALESTED